MCDDGDAVSGWPVDVTYKHFANLGNTELAFSYSKPVLWLIRLKRFTADKFSRAR